MSPFRRGAPLAPLALIAGILLIASCSRRADSFSAGLARVDALAAEGRAGRALREIKRLESRASSSTDWLSLARRAADLGRLDRAIDTVRAGLNRMPANVELSAAQAGLLVEAGRLSDALPFASILSGTAYASIAAEAEIRLVGERVPMSDGFAATPERARAFREAWLTTGRDVFLRDAAVVFAGHGDYAAALEPLEAALDRFGGSVPADIAYLRELLLSDAGRDDAVDAAYPEGTAPEILLLAADRHARGGRVGEARALWARVHAERPGFSPLPLYNLAVTEADWAEEARGLERSLALSPGFYPSLARYVRLVPEGNPAASDDSVTRALSDAGIRSLGMEAEEGRSPVRSEEARRLIDAAAARSSGTVDSRILIERYRLAARSDPDAARVEGSIWKLLEKLPRDPLLNEYAIWSLASIGRLDAALSLLDAALAREILDPDEPFPAFFSGIEAATRGDHDRALERFSLVANDAANAWRALANRAAVLDRHGDRADAIDEFSRAAEMATDPRDQSRLHYRAARIMADTRQTSRARSVAGYALELDGQNYLAAQLIRELESGR